MIAIRCPGTMNVPGFSMRRPRAFANAPVVKRINNEACTTEFFLRIPALRIVWNTRQAVVKPGVLFQDIQGGESAVNGGLRQI